MSAAVPETGVSRRAVLAGSAAATAALALPQAAFAAGPAGFPAVVAVTVAPGAAGGDPAYLRRVIEGVAAALAGSGADLARTWVLAQA